MLSIELRAAFVGAVLVLVGTGVLLGLAGCRAGGPASRSSDVASAAPVPKALPAHEAALRAFHAECETTFTSRPEFGASRMEPPRPTPHTVNDFPVSLSLPEESDASSRVWMVARVELIGIAEHKEPVVFASGKGPPHNILPRHETRPLDAFEQASLVSLRAGHALAIDERAGEIRMVGALRCAPQCERCHEDRTDDLLGAFSYVLRPAKVASR